MGGGAGYCARAAGGGAAYCAGATGGDGATYGVCAGAGYVGATAGGAAGAVAGRFGCAGGGVAFPPNAGAGPYDDAVRGCAHTIDVAAHHDAMNTIHFEIIRMASPKGRRTRGAALSVFDLTVSHFGLGRIDVLNQLFDRTHELRPAHRDLRERITQ